MNGLGSEIARVISRGFRAAIIIAFALGALAIWGLC